MPFDKEPRAAPMSPITSIETKRCCAKAIETKVKLVRNELFGR